MLTFESPLSRTGKETWNGAALPHSENPNTIGTSLQASFAVVTLNRMGKRVRMILLVLLFAGVGYCALIIQLDRQRLHEAARLQRYEEIVEFARRNGGHIRMEAIHGAFYWNLTLPFAGFSIIERKFHWSLEPGEKTPYFDSEVRMR